MQQACLPRVADTKLTDGLFCFCGCILETEQVGGPRALCVRRAKPTHIHTVASRGTSATEPDYRADGFVMPDGVLFVLRCLKLVTFLAVWIVLAWSAWRLLS